MKKKPTEKRKHESSIRIRLLCDHDELIRKAADRAGITLSDWCRERLIQAARKETAS